MSKPPGRRTWDVIQSAEVDGVDGAIDQLRQRAAAAVADYEQIGTSTETARVFQLSERDRAQAGLRVAAAARDGAAYWTRVLVELANKAGVTQRESAAALGVSTQTINRWINEPVGFNWDEFDAPTQPEDED